MSIYNYTTEIYYFIDELLKTLQKTNILNTVRKWNPNVSGRKKGLSLSEVITLNILCVLGHFNDLKAFHRNAAFYMKQDFPKLPNYENFLKASNQSFDYLIIILKVLLNISKYYAKDKIKAVDSTPLPVCKKKRIIRHKVFKGVAERGKNSVDWFYGFKLHAVCDIDGKLLSITITPGNIDDRAVLDTLFVGIDGTILGDAGYLLKKTDWKKYFDDNKYLFTGVRKNMKKIMTRQQHNLLKKREIIETVWSVLKGNLSIVYSLARSVKGLFRHYFYSIISYFFRNMNEKMLVMVN